MLLHSSSADNQSAADVRQSAYKAFSDWHPTRYPICPIAPGNTVSPDCEHVLYDPATGVPLASYLPTSKEKLDKVMTQSRTAQQEWVKLSTSDRAKILLKAADLVRDNSAWLAQVETLSTGTPIAQTEDDVSACADVITMYAGLIPTLAGTHVPVPPDNASFYYTRREPFGICAGIGAWNFPFQMAVWKSAPALAAGNAFVFKPAPITPFSAVRLAELYTEAGCPDGLFSVVLGDAEVGQNLIKHENVAKISFTGSTRGGRAVLEAASEKVIPSTLELGGNSALIIMPDADLDEAVKGALMANFYTAGQVCSNASRVFVHASIADEFRSKLVSAVSSLKVGDPFDRQVAVGSLTSCHQFIIVKDYVLSAVDQGAKLLTGGPAELTDPSLGKGNFIRPVVLDNCNDSMKAVQEEIFGPVITLLKFDTEDEVIQRANNSKCGLAGGCFTRDLATAHRMASRLECGSVYINTYNWYAPGIPFGGYKQSGFGRENCAETLHAYTQVKAVYVQGSPLEEPFPKA